MVLPASSRRCALILFTALLAAVGAARSQGPDAAVILDKAKQATGGVAWDSVRTLYVKSKISSFGLTGTSEEWHDVLTGRYVSSRKLAVLTGTDAFDGKIRWSEDEGGQFRILGGRASQEAAVNTAFRVSLSYWFPDRIGSKVEYAGRRREGSKEFEVIRVRPTGGSTFELWIDRASYLISRLVEKAGTQTTDFMNYRPVNGIKLPFTIQSGTPISVEEVRINPPLNPTKFRLPERGRPDFSLAGGKTTVTVPLDLDNNFPYVAVKINGQGPFRALLDTGGSASLSSAAAKILKLTPEGEFKVIGSGESAVSTGFVRVKSFQIGDAHLHDQIFRVFPDAKGLPDAMIGYEVFKRFVTTLDYEHRRLTLTLPDRFKYNGRTVVPFRFNDRMPEIDGSIDGIPGVFTVDTGFNGPVTLCSPFVTEHKLLAAIDAKERNEVHGSGVGGQNRSVRAQMRLLTLGSIQVPNVVALLSLDTTGSNANPYIAGYVGGGVLRRFTVTLDYGRQRIILEKNINYDKPD